MLNPSDQSLSLPQEKLHIVSPVNKQLQWNECFMKEMHLVLKVTKQQIRAYSETNPANY